MTQILDPTGAQTLTAAGAALTKRPPSLDGLTVGLLNNGKQNAGLFVKELGDLLVERYGVARVERADKPIATVACPDEVVDDLAARSDVVVTGVGDCGSCSAAAIADALAFERRGVPATVVCTDSFKATADAMAEVQGSPGYPYVTVHHPMAGLTPDQVRERAEQAAAQVVSLIAESTEEHHAA